MFETWNVYELLWTLIAAVGTYFSLLNVRNGFKDLRALKQISNGRSIVALGNIRRDLLRSIIQGTYFVIGLWAGFSSEPVTHPSTARVVLSIALLSTSIVLTYSAYLDAKDRKKLLTDGFRMHEEGYKMSLIHI